MGPPFGEKSYHQPISETVRHSEILTLRRCWVPRQELFHLEISVYFLKVSPTNYMTTSPISSVN